MGSGNSTDKEADSLIETFADHENAINCMAISEDQSLLATGSEDKTIMMWSTKTPQTECLGVLKGHNAYITCLTICDTFVISGSADNTIRKWDMTSCECLVKYIGHTSRVSRVICTGQVIFSTSYDKTAKVWDFDPEMDEDDIEYGAFRSYEGHTKGVYPLIYIPGLGPSVDVEENPLKFQMSDVLITGSADNTARSWTAETGNTLRIFRGHHGPITCMVTDPLGTVLYTGSSDRTIRSWDIKSGDFLRVMEGHEGSIICLTVVNRLMYSGGQDGKARCWVREFGDCTRIYKGHKHSIVAMKFHEGLLFTGCGDTCIRAFDSKSGCLKRLFEGHEAAVSSISIIGDKLYSGSFDGTLRVWNIKNIKDDPDDIIEEEEVDTFKVKQGKKLTELDQRLDGYLNNDVDLKSTPAELRT